MKKIPLTQGKFALVDDADFEWLNQHKWYAHKSGSYYTLYATRKVCLDNHKRIKEKMHRIILGLQPGDKQQCDHIDRNGLNNQRSNLRICTVAQNQQNSKKRRGCTSKYKGVHWHSDIEKWHSSIWVNKKSIHLGYFDLETDAGLAYNNAAPKHFRNFAAPNVI